MNTKKLYYLLAIQTCGNLSKAANILGISQPALSKFISDTQNTYGIVLFQRDKRKLVPTKAGSVILSYAQKIIDEQDRMMQAIRSVSGGLKFTIRLATAPNRGALVYSKVYSAFSKNYPEIALQLTEIYASEQAEAVRKGQIDIAIGAGSSNETVEDIVFAKEDLLVSLPSSHPLASRKSICISDLKDSTFVLQGERHSIRLIADKLFKQAGYEPLVVFESSDVLLLDSMMHQAVGVGFVSRAHVFPCKEVTYIPLDPPVFQSQHIRYPKGHVLTDAEKYLIWLLVSERLSDSRYTPVDSKELADIKAAVEMNDYFITSRYQRKDTMPANKCRKNITGERIRNIGFDTNVLRYILGIIEEHSLSGAAEKFYLPQPALSRHLKNVESTIGTPLFLRDHNRLIPTNAGKVFANNVRNLLQMEKNMNDEIKKIR